MSLSRRSFLVGSAAALAAVSLPVVAAQEVLTASPLKHFPYRRIYDVLFSPLSDCAMQCELTRDGAIVLQTAIGSGGHIRWAAFPGNEIICLKDTILGMNVLPLGNVLGPLDAFDAQMSVISCIDPPGKEPLEWIEAHWEDVYADDDWEEMEPVDRRWVEGQWRPRGRHICEHYVWKDGMALRPMVDVLDARDEEMMRLAG